MGIGCLTTEKVHKWGFLLSKPVFEKDDCAFDNDLEYVYIASIIVMIIDDNGR